MITLDKEESIKALLVKGLSGRRVAKIIGVSRYVVRRVHEGRRRGRLPADEQRTFAQIESAAREALRQRLAARQSRPSQVVRSGRDTLAEHYRLSRLSDREANLLAHPANDAEEREADAIIARKKREVREVHERDGHRPPFEVPLVSTEFLRPNRK